MNEKMIKDKDVEIASFKSEREKIDVKFKSN